MQIIFKRINPTLVENSDSFYDLFIEKHLEETLSIIQGPPGTGKTTRFRKLYLLDQGIQ